jgi:DNA polymerase-3 subunit gamma/tau
VTLALYRKYRPGRFADVVGQEHVTGPLRIALEAGRINHAYLFSGPRGCGKTSSARILARSLNCERGPTPEPCEVCKSCVALAPGGPGNIDVTELDAASHNGVDDARGLRDRAFYAPAESRYRVFIIDEAHMVTPQGFNALLKIVEEPPEHLIFVFATTEPEKVLATIRSRTHHYPFRLIPPGTMRGLLERICADEGATVAPPVLPLVLRAGGGSARDSLSILDQLLAGAGPEGVTYERAVALLGVTDVALIDDVVDALAAGDRAAVFEAVDRLVEAGLDPRRFAADLLQRLRDLTLLQAIPDAAERGLVDVAGDEVERMLEQAARLGAATLVRYGEILHAGLIEMRGATAPRLLLELLCARMLLPAASASEPSLLERLERIERRESIAPAPVPHGETAAAPPPDPDATESAAARRMFVRSRRPEPVTAAPDRPAAAPAPTPDPPAPSADAAAPPAPAVPPRPAAEPSPADDQAGHPRTGHDGGRDHAQAPLAGAPAGRGAAAAPPSPVAEPRAPQQPAATALDAAAVRRVWSEILAEAKQRSRSTGAMLVNATVRTVDGEVLVLTIGSEPLARRLSESRNTDVIADALHAVLGVRWRVRCDHGDAAPAPTPQRTAAARPAAVPQRPSRPAPTRPAPAGRPAAVDGEPLPPEPPPEDAPPDDEEAMMAEAAADTASPAARRDPEEVAIELLSAQLGAKALDRR